MKCQIKISRGFTLIEALLGVFLISGGCLAVASLSALNNQSSMQTRAVRVTMTARDQIEAALRNPAAWAQTVVKNPNLACGSQAPGCDLSPNPDGFYDLVLYSTQINEKLTYDAADSTTRYSLQGGFCAAGTADPSVNCPIKFVAQWKPLCQTYPCLNPTMQVNAKLVTEFASNSSVVLNPANYSYSTVLDFSQGAVSSACMVLNGTYNAVNGTCVPKYSGKTCASIGKPSQIVVGTHADGSIDCAPIYRGTCDADTQVVSGFDANGNAICAAKNTSSCPVSCVGQWSGCSQSCGGGTQTFSVTTPASNGGLACPFAVGAIQACNTQACPANCVGSWSACSQSCGGGNMTFTVTQPAVNGGVACVANNGDTQSCNTQACPLAVNCSGTWSACDPTTGTRSFAVTQVAQNGGAACPSSPQVCAVDCVGAWTACSGGSQTYTWSQSPLNGGLACPYPNGQTSSVACSSSCSSPTPVGYAQCCSGRWSVPPPHPAAQSQWDFCTCGNAPEWWPRTNSSGVPISSGC
jgi:Tfp pilus assembly protein PilV